MKVLLLAALALPYRPETRETSSINGGRVWIREWLDAVRNVCVTNGKSSALQQQQ
jgi:hypothetical protein